MNLKNSLILSLLILNSTHSHAAIITNNSTNELVLGGGLRLETEQPFLTCLESFNNSNIISEDGRTAFGTFAGTKNLSVKSEVIRSYQALDEYTNESYSASVSYMAASGSAHYNREAQSKLSNDTITVGIKAEADFGRYYIVEPRLKTEFAELAKKNLPAFYKRCGTEFVNGFKMGQGLNILLRTNSFSSSDYEKIDAGVSAGGSYGAASGSVQAAFASVATKLLSYSSLEVEIMGYGLEGLKSTSAIIKSDRDVQKILEIISDMLKEIQPQKSVITHYMTSQYPIADQTYSRPLSEARRQTLIDMYSSFRRVDTDLSRIREYVNHDYAKEFARYCDKENFEVAKTISCEEYTKYIRSSATALHKARIQLIDTIKKCVEGSTLESCTLDDVDTVMALAKSKIVWPKQYRRILAKADYRRKLREAIKKGT